jgi:hypothetical protein
MIEDDYGPAGQSAQVPERHADILQWVRSRDESI